MFRKSKSGVLGGLLRLERCMLFVCWLSWCRPAPLVLSTLELRLWLQRPNGVGCSVVHARVRPAITHSHGYSMISAGTAVWNAQ